MTPEKAKENAAAFVKNKENEEAEIIKNETNEFYKIAHRFIKSASEIGEYKTMLCINYENHMLDRYESVAHRVVRLLQKDGFQSSTSTNHAIKSINIPISWQ